MATTLAAFQTIPDPNLFYRNVGDGAFEQIVEYPVATEARDSMSVSWADYDNDGFLDLFVANGRVGAERNSLYHNNGDGSFTSVQSGPVIEESERSSGSAWGDYNNDGFLDLFVANRTGSNSLFQNNGNGNHWIRIQLRGLAEPVASGTPMAASQHSNRNGVGAKVRVVAPIRGRMMTQLREITGGDGYTWSQPHEAHFGLSDATVAEVVRVEWPSGAVQELTDVAADQILIVVEPPRLKVESGGQFSWPASAEGYRLESATMVDGTWSDALESVEIDGGRKRVTIQPEGAAKFYRLKGQ